MKSSRRSFLVMAAGAVAASPAAAQPSLLLFSKHLPKLNYDELGREVKRIGFDGVDLTVRPAGHVLPENVERDLPKAVEAVRAHGLSVPMITTNLLSATEPAARPTVATAARLQVPFFKLGYWRYRGADPSKTIAEVKQATAGLYALAKEHGIAAGFHNHSGDYVGTAVWDTRDIIAGLDRKWVGYYYDPCHAVAEGGVFGWRLTAHLALQQLKMVAIKDFYWEKQKGRWRMQMCPLGEGMVDWGAFFKLLASAQYAGPISLHVEYEPADELAAMARDLDFLRAQVKAAYGA